MFNGRSKSSLVLTISVLIATLLVLSNFRSLAYGAENDRGWFKFKMGGNSTIESSPLNRKFNTGLSAGFRLPPLQSDKFKVFLEPGLNWNWPKMELTSFDFYPVRLRSSTMLVDFNGTYVVPGRWERLNPFFTGGVGFLRNAFSLPDYYVGLGSEVVFTRNLGFGAHWLMGEEQRWFLGAEYKKYWSEGGNFKVIVGSVGFRFGE